MSEGWVEQILISPHAGELPTSVDRARAISGIGLEGDRYFAGAGTWSSDPAPGGKELTLIEAEVLAAIGISGAQARRNVVTRDIRLNALVGCQFWIGDIKCYGNRLCEPCAHLEALTGVTVAALVHRAGLRVDILSDGHMSIGDPVSADLVDLATVTV